jgi:hypothetical protein
MVRACAHHTDVDAVFLIPTSIAIDDIDAVAGVEVVNGSFPVDLPDL